MNKQPRVWRVLAAWSRRRPGMLMHVSRAGVYDGVWIRPRFPKGEVETAHLWVNIRTGEVLPHFSFIPKTARIGIVKEKLYYSCVSTLPKCLADN